METVIVSRHQGAIAFIFEERPELLHALVVENATAENVRGRIIVGNVPLHLAALAAEVHAIEFAGAPPRGAEYTAEDMRAAGARIVRYRVLALDMAPSAEQEDVVLRQFRSTNGRWGLTIVGPVGVKVDAPGYTSTTEVPGYYAEKIGVVDGYEIIRISQAPGCSVVLSENGMIIGDQTLATVVTYVSLQSSAAITVINAQPSALIRAVGYKGRSSATWLVQENGWAILAPPTLALAATTKDGG